MYDAGRARDALSVFAVICLSEIELNLAISQKGLNYLIMRSLTLSCFAVYLWYGQASTSSVFDIYTFLLRNSFIASSAFLNASAKVSGSSNPKLTLTRSGSAPYCAACKVNKRREINYVAYPLKLIIMR
jgi:hypothetical protein